ncbi:spermatogenesis-associated protein 31E1-like [Ovis canadensis]|uniref:spermatogenesis-associated protein 31E1-like n=1 Tax=Ovis canadensis TaxID=37174 RepID=UPI003752C725
MENSLFSLKSTFDIWLNSCSTYWVTDIILAFLFGLGLFFLFLPYLENNPSFPPPRKHGNIKPQTEPRRRRRSRKKNAAVKACRDCRKELEEVRDLTSLLQTHLGRFPEKGNFHQLSQDAPGKVCKAAPAGAHQPYREETAPTVSPAPLTEQPLPQASTLSSDSVPSSFSVHSDSSLSASQIPESSLPLDSLSPQPLAVSPTPPCFPDAVVCPAPSTASSVPQPPATMLNLSQGESMALPLGTISHRSSLPSPWRPAISGLLHSSCPLSALTWWQGAEKTWSSSTLTHFESQKEHLSSHPEEASFWGDLTNRQVEAGSLSFVNPDVQKLLEILITKRVELKIWKKKGKEVEAGFWIIKGKPEQLLGPKKQLESRKIIPSLDKRYQHAFSQVTHNHSQESRPSQAHISVATPFGDLIRPEVWEKLDHHLSKRFMQQQSDLPCRIQASQKVMQPQGKFPKLCQVQAKEGPSIPSAVLSKSSQDTQKMRSRSSARIPPGKDLCQDIEQSVGKIVKDLYMISANTTVKVPRVKPESQRELSPDRKHPEDLGVLMGINTKIQESPNPVGVHCLRLAANRIVDLSGESNAYQETENLDSSQDGEASMNTFHESLVLSPYVRQELEAYILKFQVKHMWGLVLKVLKVILRLKLRKAHCIPLPGSALKATRESGDHSKAQSPEIFGKLPQPQAGKRMITAETTSPMETAFPTPSWASEETRGPLPGGILKPSEVPLTRQGDKPPSQTPMYNFVGRIWHNECIMGAEKGNLEPWSCPSPATVRNVPQEEAGGWAFPDSYSSVTVVELDERSQSPMEQEAIEGDSGWKSTFEPCLLIKSQSNNMDLRSQSPKFSKCFSLNTKSVASSLEDLHFDAQFRKLECQGFTDRQKQAQGQATGLLLQDCETGAAGTLLKHCRPDKFIAANNLASQESLSCSQTLSSGGTTNSQMLYDVSSTGGSSQGQQEVLRRQPRRTCQSKKFVPTDGRGNYRGSKLGQRKKRLAERRAYQARRMNHSGQKKESAESLSKSHQSTLKKGQVPLESHFRIWIKQLLQWVFPNKSKRPEEHLQQGKPVAATTGYSSHCSSHQTQEPLQSRLIMEGRTAEAQVLMTAVGKILKEKMVVHYRPHASELNWCQGELWAPFGPHYCYHRFSSYKEKRRVVGDTSCYHQVTPLGHSCSKNTVVAAMI